MKLVIATACLLASLALASHALAEGRTTLTLQQPLAHAKQVIINGAIWDCANITCTADNVPSQYFGVSQCHAVALKVGPVADFKNDTDKQLQPASLDQCNKGLTPATSMTASR